MINDIVNLGLEHKMSLINDIESLGENDKYEKWRYQESQDLSDLVQKRLTYLQNPEDCSTARKLICRLNKVIAIYVTSG